MTERVSIAALAVLALTCSALEADARPRRRGRRAKAKARRALPVTCAPGTLKAEVEDSAGGYLFIDRGAADGVAVGAIVRLGARARRCTIDRVAAHHARCAAPRAKRGASVCVEAAAARSPAPEANSEGPSAEARARMQAGLRETAAVPKVVDEAKPVTDVLALRADAALQHSSFVRSDGDGFHRQRVSVWVRDIPLGFLDTTANLDLTVLTYAMRPEDARFRAGSRAQLYVHETSIARRARDGKLTLALGRIRPWYAPGVPYLDGAQVGYRFTESLEIGVLGGLLPDLVALEPGTDRWTAGVYGGGRYVGEDVQLSLQGRLAVVDAPEVGTRGELEARARLGLRKWASVSAGTRLWAGEGGFGLASVRGRIDVRPVESLSIELDGRLRKAGADPYAASLPIVGADHARGAVRWTVLEGLTLGASGGVGHVRDDDFLRGFAGPEVSLPGLFGPLGGLWLGYQENFGDLPGRTGWVQTSLRPHEDVKLWVRASYREDLPEAGPIRELGGFMQADWQFWRHMSVRGSLFGRIALQDRTALVPGGGFVGRLTLVGRY